MTRERARILIKQLAKRHRVRVYFRARMTTAGLAVSNKNKITICSEMTGIVMLGAAYHELVHVLCYRERKFWGYHNLPPLFTRTYARAVIRTGLRAERYVDARAKRMMNEDHPGLEYRAAYSSPADVRWFRKHVLAPAHLFLMGIW